MDSKKFSDRKIIFPGHVTSFSYSKLIFDEVSDDIVEILKFWLLRIHWNKIRIQPWLSMDYGPFIVIFSPSKKSQKKSAWNYSIM